MKDDLFGSKKDKRQKSLNGFVKRTKIEKKKIIEDEYISDDSEQP